MGISREEIENIAKLAAQEALTRVNRYTQEYKVPETIPIGLAESIGEETTASNWYRQRAANAKSKGDHKTAELYEEIAKDEDDHAKQFEHRKSEVTLGGGGFTVKFGSAGQLVLGHTGYEEDREFSSPADKMRVFDNLKPEELKELEKGYYVTIADIDPRAPLVRDVWNSLIIKDQYHKNGSKP